MKPRRVQLLVVSIAAALLTSCATTHHEATAHDHSEDEAESFYLPNAEASRILTVTTKGTVTASVIIQTQRAAVKETGPKESVARFGEVYAFSPSFVAVHRDEPTSFKFWNLQPDDQHTFLLEDPQSTVLLKIALPPVQERAFIFTFHQEGLFNFHCGVHQPGMNGQILVLPPRGR